MRVKKIVIALLLILVVVLTAGLLLVNECAYGGGMAAGYKSCDCSGMEWELYDRTAADGPRKTICIGIIRSTSCFMSMGGSSIACDPR